MRRFISLIVQIVLSLSLWADTADICKIKITCTENGFDISAVSNNVYVRKGNSSDPKNYVFVTNPRIEILCEGENSIIFIKNGNQKDKVTCWSQEPNMDPKLDSDTFHKLAPTNRLNWLQLSSIDVSTQVELTICDSETESTKSAKIDVRMCGGSSFAHEQLSLVCKTGEEESTLSLISNKQGDTISIPEIKLKADDKFQKLVLKRSGNKRNFVVDKMCFDGKEIPFTVKMLNMGPSHTDDIMYNTEVVVDTILNKNCNEGHHDISYVCTQLTPDGPKQVLINLPIEISKNAVWASFLIQILKVFVFLLVGLLVLYFLRKHLLFFLKKLIGKNEKFFTKKTEMLCKKGKDIVKIEADFYYHKQYEVLKQFCSKFLFGQENNSTNRAYSDYVNNFQEIKNPNGVNYNKKESYFVKYNGGEEDKYLCYSIEKKVVKGSKTQEWIKKDFVYDVKHNKILDIYDVFIPTKVNEIIRQLKFDGSFPNMIMSSESLTVNGCSFPFEEYYDDLSDLFKELIGVKPPEETPERNLSDKNPRVGLLSNPEDNTKKEILDMLSVQFRTSNNIEILNRLKNLGNLDEIPKKTVRSIVNKWNEKHPENLVDSSQMSIDALFNVIKRGYISPLGKKQIEKLLSDYNVECEGLIGPYSIEILYNTVYNKGCVDGATQAEKTNGTNVLLEELRKQIRELSQAKTNLEKEKSTWSEEKNSLQSDIGKLQRDFNELSKEKLILDGDLGQKVSRIEELEKQVNAQSQEHVVELEGKIEQLNKDISAAKGTIAQMEKDLAAEQKKVEIVIKKKEEWEGKYNKVKGVLEEVEGRHQEDVEKLKNSHQEASRKQKEKYENLLKDKDAEVTAQQKQHEEELDAQKTDYERQLSEQRIAAETALANLKNENNSAIEQINIKHQDEVNKLNDTINELGKSVNVGRDETIAKADQLIAAIGADLDKADESVNLVINQAPIFVTIINDIRLGLRMTSEQFDDFKNNEWSAPDKLQKQVIKDMQDIFIYGALNRSGWMNNVARLLSYSRLPKLHDGTDLPAELEAHGLSSSLLEDIYANMLTLLGVANMGLLVPAVLANNFDKDSYDYKNGDTWIDKFFPKVSTRNYKGKVFDIVQVGYSIDGQIERKPIVQYN